MSALVINETDNVFGRQRFSGVAVPVSMLGNSVHDDESRLGAVRHNFVPRKSSIHHGLISGRGFG
jgi:hypothetical protein